MAAKVCRLCTGDSGPFFNIFGLEVDLAGPIKALLPFEIDEWDCLPHKICYRCSAKITELHEFIEKCVESQKYFKQKLKKNSLVKRNEKAKKTRESWEAALLEKNMSNDEYCDQLIKKAMQSLPAITNESHLIDSPSHSKKSKLKDVKVVVTRLNSANKSADETKEDVGNELSDNITFLDVSSVDSIYSCKLCSKIFTNKEKIKAHICNTNAKTDSIDTNVTDKPKDVSKEMPAIIPVANNANMYLVHLPNGEYVALQSNNSFTPNTTITNTNVTINAPNMYEARNKIEPIEDFNPFKKKRKLEKSDEPYPVSLFCSTKNFDASMIDPISNTNDVQNNVDEVNQNKQYKIVQNQKPGKIVIAVDKPADPPKKKRGRKPKKPKPDLPPPEENFTAEDERPIFTFFNIVPNSDEPYVLPSTVQEAQVTTTGPFKLKRSTETKQQKEKCTICDRAFSSHAKLVKHVDEHFNHKSVGHKNHKKRKRF